MKNVWIKFKVTSKQYQFLKYVKDSREGEWADMFLELAYTYVTKWKPHKGKR